MHQQVMYQQGKQWFGPLETLHQSKDSYSYVALKIREPTFAHVIPELCFCRDSTDPFVLTSTVLVLVLTSRETVQFVEYLW